MTRRFLASAALALALAACGGGDSGGGSPPPTGGGGGTPTPSPSPTPSPTPTPTYQTFAQLTGVQNFNAICSGTRTRSAQLLPQISSSFGQAITIQSDRAAPNYVIRTVSQSPDERFELSFDQTNRDTTPNTERYSKAGLNGFTDRFSVNTPLGNGTPYDYVRYGQVSTLVSTDPRTFFCAFGVPTVVTDVPAASVTYRNTVIFGSLTLTENNGNGARSTYVMTPSVLTLVANPATGRVTINLDLKGRLVTGSTVSTEDTSFGVFTGSADVSASNGGYNDLLLATGNVARGSIAGGFFGPRGREGVLAFNLGDTDNSNRQLVVAATAFLLPQS